jgi:hypothetical protein
MNRLILKAPQEYQVGHITLDPQQQRDNLRCALEVYLPLAPSGEEEQSPEVQTYLSQSYLAAIRSENLQLGRTANVIDFSVIHPRLMGRGGLGKTYLLEEARQRLAEQYHKSAQESRTDSILNDFVDLYNGSYSHSIAVDYCELEIDILTQIGARSNEPALDRADIAVWLNDIAYQYAENGNIVKASDYLLQGYLYRTTHAIQEVLESLLVKWYFIDLFREEVAAKLRKAASRFCSHKETHRYRNILQRMFNRHFRNGRRSRRLLLHFANPCFLMLPGDTAIFDSAPRLAFT